MITDQQKLEAATKSISNSILHGWTIDAKVSYIRQLLPDHYEVKESKEKGNVHCKSSIGIDDDEQWSYLMQAIKQRFDDFVELFHNTCYNHTDFTLYFKKQLCPESFIHDGTVYDCVGNDDGKYWAEVDGESKGFYQGDCILPNSEQEQERSVASKADM
jgi:hypothetical protein